MNPHKYKFSFVMPVYNVEDYLAETVESILAQTMDFEQNCEIIFVNDGSPDNSEEVCLRYQTQFPNNVKYIKQENAGPGIARNKGIAVARGKYISLVDSDDKISPITIDEVYRFFEKHYDEVDVVCIKQQFFEARLGDHPLNYKFTGNKIVDLTKDFDHIQMAVTSSFFKADVLQKSHQFDELVGRYAEDSLLMGKVLLDKSKFGVVTRPTYFYRKRLDQASSLDTTKTDRFWYLETPKRAWYELFSYAKKQGGIIPKFIQYMVMYDLHWRFKQSVQTALSDGELAEYKVLLFGLLDEIDDDVILAQKNFPLAYKLYILGKKHRESVSEHTQLKHGKFYYRGNEIYNPAKEKHSVQIEFLDIQDKLLGVEGFFDGMLLADSNLQFRSGTTTYDVTPVARPHHRLEFLGELVGSRNCFTVHIPVSAGATIEAIASAQMRRLPLTTLRFSHLSQSAPFAYCVNGGFLIRKMPTTLQIYDFSAWRRLWYELAFWAALAKRVKLRETISAFKAWRQARASNTNISLRDLKWLLIPAKSAARNVYSIGFRLAYFAAKPFVRKPIWLVSDRVMEADDNGEVFFRYLSTIKDVPAKVYFVISKKSSEYPAITTVGKVIDYHSWRYRLMFLLSDKVISSEADDFTINAFGGRIHDLVDLYNFDFVFLQHGIIKDDISGWLNRWNKNIKMFVTSVTPEYESIVNGSYGYGRDVVQLTGLPRYDLLDNQPKNKLLIMPTWRQELAGGVDPHNGQRLYNPAFKHSEYYNFYQNLMNDARLQSAMLQHGFTGEFYLHHSFQRQIRDFSAGEKFQIMQMPFDYPKAKREGNVLVTDFSSVAFDFAYLKKPVIYAQFDNDRFYKLHTGQEGYFSYEEDGFGPIKNNYEDTIGAIIAALESGCKMEQKYQTRVENFFAYNDKNNSQRVYNAILAMNR